MNAFCLCKTFFIYFFLICNFSRRQISLFLSGVRIEKVPQAYSLVYFKINTHFSKFLKFGERWMHVHTVRPHMPSSSQIQSACYKKVKSGIGSPVWNVSMVDIHLRKLLWVYCPGHTEVKGNDRADRLAGKATLTSGLFLWKSELLRSLKHYMRAQSQRHRTVDRLEERGVKRGSARRSSLKGRKRAIVTVRRTVDPF